MEITSLIRHLCLLLMLHQLSQCFSSCRWPPSPSIPSCSQPLFCRAAWPENHRVCQAENLRVGQAALLAPLWVQGATLDAFPGCFPHSHCMDLAQTFCFPSKTFCFPSQTEGWEVFHLETFRRILHRQKLGETRLKLKFANHLPTALQGMLVMLQDDSKITEQGQPRAPPCCNQNHRAAERQVWKSNPAQSF